MAKEKAVDKDIEELKRLLKAGQVIIGTERVIKGLRAKKVQKVFLASNCMKETAGQIDHYSGLSGAKVVRLKYPNDELGTLCRKQFSISVLGSVR